MTLKITSLSPMLRTDDIKATIHFYEEVLGFTCENFEEEWGWASLEKNGIHIMLATPNAHQTWEKPSFTGSIYFRVENVLEYWENVKESAKVCYEPEVFDYGMTEFAIYDNNGYLLQFGEEVAVK